MFSVVILYDFNVNYRSKIPSAHYIWARNIVKILSVEFVIISYSQNESCDAQ